MSFHLRTCGVMALMYGVQELSKFEIWTALGLDFSDESVKDE